MIIINQDKTSIVNFDNISSIQIDPAFGNVGCIEINAVSESGDLYELGIYETEERAKQILQEIKTMYACSEMLKIPSVEPTKAVSGLDLMTAFIYEMPKDEEEQ